MNGEHVLMRMLSFHLPPLMLRAAFKAYGMSEETSKR